MDTIEKSSVTQMLFDEQMAVVIKNERIGDRIYKMTLLCDTSKIVKAGRFINILIDGFYLRRPISICDFDDNGMSIIFRVVGDGTAKLATYKNKDVINVLMPLGNGYDISAIEGEKILLVGGGIGVPPLYNLAKQLKANGYNVTVVMGFNSRNELFYEKEFAKIADKVLITTVDGSMGTQGYVTDAFYEEEYDYYFACGPEAMLRALLKLKIKGQLSFEARMGCGFGACMGCTCKTKFGNKRICVEGPIFKSEEVL